MHCGPRPVAVERPRVGPASRSTASSLRPSAPARTAWKSRRYGASGPWPIAPPKRVRDDHRAARAGGPARPQSRSACAAAAIAVTGFVASRGPVESTSRAPGRRPSRAALASRAARSATPRSSASACATDGGPASTETACSSRSSACRIATRSAAGSAACSARSREPASRPARLPSASRGTSPWAADDRARARRRAPAPDARARPRRRRAAPRPGPRGLEQRGPAASRRAVCASAPRASVGGPPCAIVSAALTTTTTSVSTRARCTRTAPPARRRASRGRRPRRRAPTTVPTEVARPPGAQQSLELAAPRPPLEAPGDEDRMASRAAPPAPASSSITPARASWRGSACTPGTGSDGGSTTIVTRPPARHELPERPGR